MISIFLLNRMFKLRKFINSWKKSPKMMEMQMKKTPSSSAYISSEDFFQITHFFIILSKINLLKIFNLMPSKPILFHETDGQKYWPFFGPKMPPKPTRFQTTNGHEYWAFSGPEFAFNNFYSASFMTEGHVFNCSEQHYQWKEAKYLGDLNKAARILECKTPMELTLLEPTINFADKEWERMKRRAMFNSNLYKFSQNIGLAHMLLSTGNMPIVYATPEDEYWSIGISIDDDQLKDKARWTGQNVMGELLEYLRHELEFFMMDLGWDPPPFTAMRF